MKKKVLHVLGGMGRGGAPSFIINNLREIDGQKVQFDFLVRKDNCAFNETIEKHGGHVFVVAGFPGHLIANYKQTLKFFQERGHEYEAVHVHANALYYILPLILGKRYGIKKLILHSHNTQSNVCLLQPLHYMNKLFVDKLANVFLACGESAGKWMYGNRRFEVINNAVDVQKFAFDTASRKEIRSHFGISDDTLVIGNVGRFEDAKNHRFLIDLFFKYHSQNYKSILLLVGDGSLKTEIELKVKELGIQDSVYFLGVRSDVEKLYSSFDLFLMPSIFEGLPFVLIEAQCSGVKCLVSENVTTEALITDLVITKKLNDSIESWCEEISKSSQVINTKKRLLYSQVVKEKYYDIQYTAERLTFIYTS